MKASTAEMDARRRFLAKRGVDTYVAVSTLMSGYPVPIVANRACISKASAKAIKANLSRGHYRDIWACGFKYELAGGIYRALYEGCTTEEICMLYGVSLRSAAAYKANWTRWTS